jgi:hypothetical protein
VTERLLHRLERLIDSKSCYRTFVVEVIPVNGSTTNVLAQGVESIYRSNIYNKRSVKGFWNPLTGRTSTTNVLSKGLESINRSNICNKRSVIGVESINRSNLYNKRSVTGFGIH